MIGNHGYLRENWRPQLYTKITSHQLLTYRLVSKVKMCVDKIWNNGVPVLSSEIKQKHWHRIKYVQAQNCKKHVLINKQMFRVVKYKTKLNWKTVEVLAVLIRTTLFLLYFILQMVFQNWLFLMKIPVMINYTRYLNS